MLVKDKDILVEEPNQQKVADKALDAQRRKEYKANMHEAWGDAFDYFLVGITSKYLEFRGRATRLEFWGFYVATLIVFFALTCLGNYIDMKMLPYYYLMSTAIPTLAVTTRRFHDLNRSAFWHVGLEVVLLVLAIFLGFMVGVLALIWGVYLVILLSNPSDLTEGIYGEPNEEDEIYGLNNMIILNKFRFLALTMLTIAIGWGMLEFDSWNRNMQQNVVVTEIMESISNKGIERGFSDKEINMAMTQMRKTLKSLAGKELSEEDISKYINEALNSVKIEKAPN
jgi:uncharacterized membrane protein YhaH (DUF805 family)